MTLNGVITSFATRLDTGFQTAATPPTTRQLVDSVYSRASAEFQESFSASKFRPDPSKQVDILV